MLANVREESRTPPRQEGSDDEGATYRWVLSKALPTAGPTNLPADFPILVDEVTGIVCEPVLLFLYHIYSNDQLCEMVLNTLRTYAYSLKEWMQYLDEVGKTWDSATKDDITAFSRVMLRTTSQLGKNYSSNTINQRKATVQAFYRWAVEEKIVVENAKPGTLLREGVTTSKRIKRRAGENQHISVIGREQARHILDALGVHPSTLEKQTSCSLNASDPSSTNATYISIKNSCGIRLSVEIAINAGLRISEICNLKVEQFSSLPAEVIDTKTYSVLVQGKGRRKEPVDFSGVLIKAIQAYIKFERTDIVTVTGAEKIKNLILNPIKSNRWAGAPISVRTLQRAFAKACIESGQIKNEKVRKFVIDSDGTTRYEEAYVIHPIFVFHDLRHTYAVWTYYIRKKMGDNEPWLYIQKQLRHASLEVTMNIYLKSTREFEASVSDEYKANLYAET